MGRVSSSYDNALAESFFQGLKRELLHGRRWVSKAQTWIELFRWLSYYNQRRRHSALATSHRPISNNNSPHHIRCRSSHETRCPLTRLSLNNVHGLECAHCGRVIITGLVGGPRLYPAEEALFSH
jgi:hypothetical protein